MTWWEYVKRTAKADADSPKAMSAVTGIDAPNFSKWKGGQIPGAEKVADFARGYKRPVLEAFVAAGFLESEEAGEVPAAPPDYGSLSIDDLAQLMRQRIELEVNEKVLDRLLALRDQELAFGGDSDAAMEHVRALDRAIALIRAEVHRIEGGEAHDRAAANQGAEPELPKQAGDASGSSLIVGRYLQQAAGDAAVASSLLAHDGAKGANVDVFTWTAALEELHRLEQEAADTEAARDEDAEPPKMGDD